MKLVVLLIPVIFLTGCRDEDINPEKFTVPATLQATRSSEGILLEWYSAMVRYLSSAYLYDPYRVSPIDKIEVYHSLGDTLLGFKKILESYGSGNRFVFKPSAGGGDHYFRLKTISGDARPFVSPPIHIQYNANPEFEPVIELPYDYLLKLGNFSPDGQSLIYSRNFKWKNEGNCCEDYNQREVYIMDLVTGVFGPLAGSGGLITLDEPLSVSPDGMQVAFSRVDDQYHQDIYTYHMEYGNVEPLLESAWTDSYPSFSPDGRYLAFLYARSGRDEVWLMNLQNRELDQLTGKRGYYINSNLVWSPDGRKLYFKCYSDDQSFGIYSIHVYP